MKPADILLSVSSVIKESNRVFEETMPSGPDLIEMARLAVEANPDDAGAWFTLGFSLKSAGRTEEAIDADGPEAPGTCEPAPDPTTPIPRMKFRSR